MFVPLALFFLLAIFQDLRCVDSVQSVPFLMVIVQVVITVEVDIVAMWVMSAVLNARPGTTVMEKIVCYVGQDSILSRLLLSVKVVLRAGSPQ